MIPLIDLLRLRKRFKLAYRMWVMFCNVRELKLINESMVWRVSVIAWLANCTVHGWDPNGSRSTSEIRHHFDAHILSSGDCDLSKALHRKFSKIQTNWNKGGPKNKNSRFLRTHGVDRDIQLALKIFKFRFLGPLLFRFSWIFKIFWYTWLDWSNGAELRTWFLLLACLLF